MNELIVAVVLGLIIYHIAIPVTLALVLGAFTYTVRKLLNTKDDSNE